MYLDNEQLSQIQQNPNVLRRSKVSSESLLHNIHSVTTIHKSAVADLQ